ncbi:MAG: hypothetical protein KBC43_06955 [Bacteroidales bacterium]|nr:hypothetical protein [Bacteroidales bacterium]
MKSIYKFSIILFLLFASVFSTQASITYGLDNKCNTAQLVVSVTPDQNYSGGQAVWTPAAFTISYPMSYGPSVLGAVTNQLGFAFAPAGLLGNDGTNYYQKYAHSAGSSLSMISGNSYDLVLIALSGPGIGVYCTFEIPASTNAWVGTNNGFSIFSNSNGNQIVNPYGVTTLPNVPLFTGIFWDGISWCGGSGVNQQPGAADGSLTCYVTGLSGQLSTPVATPAIVNKLKVYTGGQLTIMPGAALTVSDSTIIRTPQGLVIAADANGTGSFKNNAVVNKTQYLTGGSITVQVYMANDEDPGDFHMHLIGIPAYDPVIADPATTGPAYQHLQNFELENGSTYAYKYDEPGNQWVNLWEPLEQIPRMGGLAVSDVSGVSKTLDFTGKISTGNVNQPTLPASWVKSITGEGGQGLYLFSNPYACGMNLSALHADNYQRINAIFWTWENDPADNYGTWWYDEEETGDWIGTLGIGDANGVIGPGQGFFGQYYYLGTTMRTLSSASTDNERVHTYTPILKSTPINFLRVLAEGNDSKDEIIIRFSVNGTDGFDVSRDVENWASMSENATQIHTYAGLHELTINTLPSLLPGQLTSVPMYFKCGAQATYKITAENIESFESGTEIWLEDLAAGGPWYNLSDNPEYVFDGSAEDDVNRFVLHFFGPTSIEDPSSMNTDVRIYGYGHDAYIVNFGSETVKEFVAYDLMGRELHRGTLPNNSVNKVQIGDVSAYYIVKVITKEGNVYTGKVYITK